MEEALIGVDDLQFLFKNGRVVVFDPDSIKIIGKDDDALKMLNQNIKHINELIQQCP